MSEENKVTIMQQKKAVAVFSEFEAQLKAFEKESSDVVFDMETTKGNKEARSFIANIRKSKKPVAEAHQAAKADVLEFGRKLDAEKNRIIARIDGIIEPYATKLDEIKEREEKRVLEINERIESIYSLAKFNNPHGTPYSAKELRVGLKSLKAIDIDDSFGEFIEDAEKAKDDSKLKLESRIVIVKDQEAKAAELVRLKKEKAVREQKEKDEEIRKNAKAKAESEAKAKAKELSLENERKALRLKLEVERVKREKQEAKEKAESDKKEAIEKERKDAKEKAEKLEKDRLDKIALDEANAAKKAANTNHQKKINNEALKCFEALGISNGQEIISLIAKGEIKNITVNY